MLRQVIFKLPYSRVFLHLLLLLLGKEQHFDILINVLHEDRFCLVLFFKSICDFIASNSLEFCSFVLNINSFHISLNSSCFCRSFVREATLEVAFPFHVYVKIRVDDAVADRLFYIQLGLLLPFLLLFFTVVFRLVVYLPASFE